VDGKRLRTSEKRRPRLGEGEMRQYSVVVDF
jgi:hypothetical protein